MEEFCITFQWIFVNILLTLYYNYTENPFIRRLTPDVLRVENGEAVTLVFHVAVNSDGSRWSTSMTTFSFTNSTGQTRPANFTARDADYPQQYSLLIEVADESHAGTYSVSVPG